MTKRLTMALCLLVCVFSAYPVAAEGRAALGVRLSDLDLSTDEGVERLADRFVRRFWSICGSPNEATLTYVLTGGGLEERAACKAELRVSPESRPEVKRAFAMALDRMR